MKISAINNKQTYNNNVNFQAKTRGKAGAIIGGITGLMMTGAMMATYPLDWQNVKTWPIVAMSLTAGGALEGKMIGDSIDRKKDKDKKD